MWLTPITLFEIRFGLELLSKSRRRRDLERAFDLTLAWDFAGRVLNFDVRGADQAAIISARRRAVGQNVAFRDIQIAGIALAQQAKIATRNLRHFQDLAVDVMDPWDNGAA